MNKNYVIGAVLVALLVTLITSVLYSSVSRTTNEEAKRLQFNSAVCIYKKPAGMLSFEQVGECTHNTMMNNGLNFSIGKIFGVPTSSGTATVVALGNLTSAETATLLTINATGLNAPIPDCGLTNETVTPAYVSNANVSLSYLWTSTCNSEIVNTTAIYNGTTGAFGGAVTMIAGKNFATSVTLQSGDQLNVTWYVWAS